MEIHFQSRWFERCIKTYLGVSGRALTEEDVQDIKYLWIFLRVWKGGAAARFCVFRCGR